MSFKMGASEAQLVGCVTCTLFQPYQTIRPGARSQRGEAGMRGRHMQIHHCSPGGTLLRERQL